MKVRNITNVIEADGWRHVRTKGSHRQFKHDTKIGLVTVPGHPGDDIAPGTLNSLETSGVETMKYLIVIEPINTGFSAYSPDLPGCISTGRTKDEVEANMHEAIEFHLEGLSEEGYPLPEPSSASAYVEVAA